MVPAFPDETELRRVGRYVLYGELAAGGMATVHLGRLMGQAGFSKMVAIKRLHQHLATEPEFVTMLIDEAKLASFIHHPNVVSSLDVIKEGDELLLVMDYVEGETLARLLGYAKKDGRPLRSPAIPVVVRVLTDVLAGLHAAHTAKTRGGRELHIVHRDVSPQNIMVGVDGIARVLDFGIAKAAHRRANTRPGRVKGKFAYMSPEQVRGAPVDARTDVFAAGVVLWECLTKQRLFAAQDKNDLTQVLTTVVVPPSTHNPDVSAALDRVVMRALSRDRDARFESAAEFADALSKVAEQSSSVEVGRWVAGAAKKTLDQRRGLLDQAEETTVDGVLRAMQKRAEDDTRVIGPVRVAEEPSRPLSESGSRPVSEIVSRPISEVGAMSLPPLPAPSTLRTTVRRARPAARPWTRIVLIAAGLALLIGAGVAVVSDMTTSPSTELITAPPVQAPARSPVVEEDVPPPIVLASDLPRLPPQEVVSADTSTLQSDPDAPPAASSTAPVTPSKPEVRKSREIRAPAAPDPAPKVAPPADSATVAAAACDPPYRIDAAGIRRVKRECL